MLPGERITLIKKIAGRLADDDAEEIRLTLRQFGLIFGPYYHEGFSFDSFLSVAQSIEDASDDTLISLHEYVFGESVPSPTSQARESAAAEIWPADRFRLFVSHTSTYKDAIGDLRFSLEYEGISAFVAHADIEPTRTWQDVIESALDTCDALAAYLTPDFPGSNWTDQEVGFCVGRAVLILPIRVGLDPYGFIGKYQALQGFGKTPEVLAGEVSDLLLTHPLTVTRMAVALVHRFAEAYSFDNARKMFGRIQRIPEARWTPEMVQIAGDAAANNSQLLNCDVGGRPLPSALDSMLQPIRKRLAQP